MRQLFTCSFCDCAILIMNMYIRNFEDQGCYFLNNDIFALLHKTIKTDLLYKWIHNTCEAGRRQIFYNRHLLQQEDSRRLLYSMRYWMNVSVEL